MELSAWFESLLFGGGDRPAEGAPVVVTVIGSGGKGGEGAPVVVTVIGSGGKTSLIWHLAASMASTPTRKILVTPTTKMLVPPPEEKLYDRFCNTNLLCDTLPAALPGVTLAGRFNEATGKLESLPQAALAQLATNRSDAYDLVLVEGDGSRGLPLKAWADYEPVVPAFTTLTIGVIPVWPLGKPVSESLVHRLPLFLSLTGAAVGEPVRPEHIAALISGSGGDGAPGLFAKARGEKLLFLSQIEDDEALAQAREITRLLPDAFRNGLCGIIAGNVRQNRVLSLN